MYARENSLFEIFTTDSTKGYTATIQSHSHLQFMCGSNFYETITIIRRCNGDK